MPGFHIRNPLLVQFHAMCTCWDTAGDGSGGSLPATQIKYLALGFGLVKSGLLQASGGVSQHMGVLSLSLSFTHAGTCVVCLSASKIRNKNQNLPSHLFQWS